MSSECRQLIMNIEILDYRPDYLACEGDNFIWVGDRKITNKYLYF